MKKIPLPRPDPRPQQPMDVQDHPTHNFSDRNNLEGKQVFKDFTSALGATLSYRAETGDMANTVDISEKVPRRQND